MFSQALLKIFLLKFIKITLKFATKHLVQTIGFRFTMLKVNIKTIWNPLSL